MIPSIEKIDDVEFFPETVATNAGSNTTRIFVDTAQSWTTDQWIGYQIRVNGQRRRIVTNTATTLTVERSFDNIPSSNATYSIYGNSDRLYLTSFNPSMFGYNVEEDFWMQGDEFDHGVSCCGAAVPTNGQEGVNIDFIFYSPNGVLTASINNGGSGYAIGDTVTLTGGVAAVSILEVDAIGTAISIELIHCGKGYSNGTVATTTWGSGVGLTVNITVGKVGYLVTTSHNFKKGQSVKIYGALTDTSWNDTFTILGVDSFCSFSIANPSATANASFPTQSSETLHDATKNWAANEHCGRLLTIYDGSGPTAYARTVQRIVSNTQNSITIAAAHNGANKVIPATNGYSRYQITDVLTFGAFKEYTTADKSRSGYITSVVSQVDPSTATVAWDMFNRSGKEFTDLTGRGYHMYGGGSASVTAQDPTFDANNIPTFDGTQWLATLTNIPELTLGQTINSIAFYCICSLSPESEMYAGAMSFNSVGPAQNGSGWLYRKNATSGIRGGVVPFYDFDTAVIDAFDNKYRVYGLYLSGSSGMFTNYQKQFPTSVSATPFNVVYSSVIRLMTALAYGEHSISKGKWIAAGIFINQDNLEEKLKGIINYYQPKAHLVGVDLPLVINDSSKNWENKKNQSVNDKDGGFGQWVPNKGRIVSGTGVGTEFNIISNNSNQLVATGFGNVMPDSTSKYVIMDYYGIASEGSSGILDPQTLNWENLWEPYDVSKRDTYYLNPSKGSDLLWFGQSSTLRGNDPEWMIGGINLTPTKVLGQITGTNTLGLNGWEAFSCFAILSNYNVGTIYQWRITGAAGYATFAENNSNYFAFVRNLDSSPRTTVTTNRLKTDMVLYSGDMLNNKHIVISGAKNTGTIGSSDGPGYIQSTTTTWSRLVFGEANVAATIHAYGYMRGTITPLQAAQLRNWYTLKLAPYEVFLPYSLNNNIIDYSKNFKVSLITNFKYRITSGDTGVGTETTITSHPDVGQIYSSEFIWGTPTADSTTYAIIPKRGANGTPIIWLYGIDQGKYLFVPDGSKTMSESSPVIRLINVTGDSDKLLYATEAFNNVSTSYAYDGEERVYINNGTNRISYMDCSNGNYETYVYMPMSHNTQNAPNNPIGTSSLYTNGFYNNRMEVMTTNGVRYLYIMRNLGQEFWRVPIP